ncbi:MAG: hypothetical protein Ct9H300mP28_02420 [Pseudomonadota bacterium]|nr:MAG: hypothetical protein Ct9H300mP28_02420 [Pseudomonadota bacterium]
MKGAAFAGVAAAGTLGVPNFPQKAATVLKVQAAGGGGIFLENAKSYFDRVNKMAGGGLKIDLLSVNSVVKTSQMQDAVHRGSLMALTMCLRTGIPSHRRRPCSEPAPASDGRRRRCSAGFTMVAAWTCSTNLMGSLGFKPGFSFFNSPMPAQPLGGFSRKRSDNHHR